MAAVSRECGCGRKLYALGKRCRDCQAAYKAARAAARPPRQKRTPKAKPGRYPAHLAWIRTLPCAVRSCPNPSIAAHVRENTGGGMGMKPADEFCVPLCNEHHTQQHSVGHRAFDEKYGVSLRALAERLAILSPHLKNE